MVLTAEKLDKIVSEAQFSAMQKNKATNFTLASDSSHAREDFSFVRKGKVGVWKDYFTIAQNDWMDGHIADKLIDTDFVLQYE